MKKKKVDKMTDTIIESMTTWMIEREDQKGSIKKAGDQYKWGEYDEEVSNKFRKLVFNLLKYPDNLDIDIYSDSVRINTSSVKSIKSSLSSNSKPTSLSKYGEDELRIEISSIGFVIYCNNRKSSKFKDENIYNELIDPIKEKLKQVNIDNFNEIWSEISKDSGIMRDSNLDDLLG